MWKSLTVSAGMIGSLFAGWPVPKVALVAGALLVLFIGLFIVVAGVETTALPNDFFGLAQRFHLERTSMLSAFCGAALEHREQRPAVLVFKPFVSRLGDPGRVWLALAMSTTPAGNLTILGSVANLIVVQKARHEVHISFWITSRSARR